MRAGQAAKPVDPSRVSLLQPDPENALGSGQYCPMPARVGCGLRFAGCAEVGRPVCRGHLALLSWRSAPKSSCEVAPVDDTRSTNPRGW